MVWKMKEKHTGHSLKNTSNTDWDVWLGNLIGNTLKKSYCVPKLVPVEATYFETQA